MTAHGREKVRYRTKDVILVAGRGCEIGVGGVGQLVGVVVSVIGIAVVAAGRGEIESGNPPGHVVSQIVIGNRVGAVGVRKIGQAAEVVVKVFCPTLGKVKIAQKLARAGIHIGKTTVERILKEKPAKAPESASADTEKRCRIVAKYPSHTWHTDLTAVSIGGGFWTNWVPNAIWQHWPVCWWLLNVVDHFSRRSMGFAVFKSKPSSEEVTAAMDRIMLEEDVRPKHIIVDQGSQFKCEHFEENWCKEMNILPRFGAVGRHGSIAVVEIFHRTIKDILQLIIVPEDQPQFEREVSLIINWHNEHRPHDTLGGKTGRSDCHRTRMS